MEEEGLTAIKKALAAGINSNGSAVKIWDSDWGIWSSFDGLLSGIIEFFSLPVPSEYSIQKEFVIQSEYVLTPRHEIIASRNRIFNDNFRNIFISHKDSRIFSYVISWFVNNY